MEIHIPKPWHGLREFLKEYATIVVGVLTALAGEQAVEAVHHQHQLEIAEKSLKVDFANFVRYRAEQVAATSCIAARLAELRAIAADSAREGELGEVGPIPQPPGHSWEITSWDTMVGSQAATYVPQADMMRYSLVAHWARDAHNTIESEVRTWATLGSLSGPPRPFTGAEQSKLRSDIALAAYLSAHARGIADTAEVALVESGLLTPEEIARERAKGEQSDRIKPLCSPIEYKPVGDQHLTSRDHDPRLIDKAQPAK